MRPRRLAALGIAVAVSAIGCGRRPADHVLTPEAAPLLQGQLDRLAPVLRLGDARLSPDHALVRLCREATTAERCVTLRLGCRDAPCSGELMGAWCVQVKDGSLASGERDALRVAFAADAPGLWTEVADDEQGGGMTTAVWFALAIVATAAYVLVPAGAAWLCVRSARRDRAGTRRPRSGQILAGAAYAALLLSVLAGARAITGDTFRFDPENERFFQIALACVRRGQCPSVGQPMGGLRVHLGPLFYEVLSLLVRLSPSPTTFYALVLGQLAASATLLAVAGDGLLGFPWGLVAGALLGFSPLAARVIYSPEHAPLAIWPGVGFAAALLAWLRWRSGAAFVLAAASLSLATQMHGVYFFLVPALGLVALLARPRRRVLVAAVLAAVLPYAPWIVNEVVTRGADFRGMSGPVSTVGSLASALATAVDPALWAAATAGLAATAATLRRPGPGGERALAGGLLMLGVACIATVVLARRAWHPRYGVLLLPVMPLLGAAGARALVSIAARMRAPAERAGGRREARRAVIWASWLVPIALIGGLTSWTVGERWRAARALEPETMWTFDEQRRLAALLSARGFRVEDLERRVHGTGWDPTQLQLTWLIADATSTRRREGNGPTESVLLVDRCRQVAAGFAIDQAPLTRFGQPATAVLYIPRLQTPVLAEFPQERGPPWTGPVELPLAYSADRARLGTLHPGLADDPSRTAILAAWIADDRGRWTFRSTFAAGDDARSLVVLHDEPFPMAVRVDGLPVPPLRRERESSLVGVRDYFPLPVGRSALLEVTIERNRAEVPKVLDLHEAPEPLCALRAPPE